MHPGVRWQSDSQTYLVEFGVGLLLLGRMPAWDMQQRMLTVRTLAVVTCAKSPIQ